MIYVGVLKMNHELREVFETPSEPTLNTHGHKYAYVVGPFKTKKAAFFMADQFNNPSIITPNDAERRVSDIELEYAV